MLEKSFILNSKNIRDVNEQLVSELRKVRKKAKISQIKLSELAEIPQTTISRIESFSTEASLNTLVRYAESMGMELSIVLKQKENKKSKYLVALETDKFMEGARRELSGYEFIEANTAEEACDIYNKKNNCSYFSEICIGKLSENEKMVILSDFLSKKLLSEFELLDNEKFYLLAEIDGNYVECAGSFYYNFYKIDADLLPLIKNKINNNYCIVGKYDNNGLNVPIQYIEFISRLINEKSVKVYQRKKVK